MPLPKDPKKKELWKQRQREAHLGKCLTEETKAKMSIARLGDKNPNWGKQLSKEAKAKQSAAMLGNKNPNWGKPRPQHIKDAVSKAHKGKPGNIGKANGNWKGGITPEYELARKSPEYKEWRGGVFTRDNYTCQSCNKRGGNLHAHHAKPFSDYPELRYDLDNGLTVCRPCHRVIHSALAAEGYASYAQAVMMTPSGKPVSEATIRSTGLPRRTVQLLS